MELDFLSPERRSVIRNIEAAASCGSTFAKVELSDPKLTREDVERVILPFDNMRRNPLAKARSYMARILAERLTEKFNADTELRGVEYALSVGGAAIITSNHYNPTDSTPIRLLACECGRRKALHIVIQQSNVFMSGAFGFLMKNCNTHPVSDNTAYMNKNLHPALEKILKQESFVLIYPEQEMWYNYKKPRPLRDGAYHYAARFGVPIIPTFTEMVTLAGERDGDGFLPIKHILHIMPPIYPDGKLSVRENRLRMQLADYEAKRNKYEEVYGIPLDSAFSVKRDIAGLFAD